VILMKVPDVIRKIEEIEQVINSLPKEMPHAIGYLKEYIYILRTALEETEVKIR
jgi:hypothetical protein